MKGELRPPIGSVACVKVRRRGGGMMCANGVASGGVACASAGSAECDGVLLPPVGMACASGCGVFGGGG